MAVNLPDHVTLGDSGHVEDTNLLINAVAQLDAVKIETLAIGTVETGAAGAPATATIVPGPGGTHTLSLTIPAGTTGQPGADSQVPGPPGEPGPPEVSVGATEPLQESVLLWVEASGEAPAALTPWATALANQATAPAKMLVIGDSFSEGQGASTRANRWFNLLRKRLRDEHDVTQGGEGYIPAFYVVGAPDSPWQSYSAFTGSPTQSNVNGSLGYRTVFLDGTDSLFYPDIVGTSMDIWWIGGGGVLGYQIDGGAVQQIDTAGVYHTDYRTTVSLGTSGAHGIGIGVVSGTVGFSGFTTYDGDPGKGIQFFDAARSGSKSADHLIEGSELIKAVQTIAPQMVIVELGGNDALQQVAPATFQANLQQIVSGALGAVTPTPSVLIIGLFTPHSSLIPVGVTWTDYKDAMAAVAASDPTRVAYLDLALHMPPSDMSGSGYYDDDGMHPNDAGHAKIAELVHAAISAVDIDSATLKYRTPDGEWASDWAFDTGGGGGGGLDQATADGLYVNVAGDTVTGPLIISNTDRLKYGLTVERTVASTAITDAEIFRVMYATKRATWTNEKGNLRTSNEASKAEVALKVIGASQAEGGTGNMMEVLDLAGNVQTRIGPLGRQNFNKGIRMVGDTIEIRDSTEADTSTIAQPLGGSLTIAPKTSLSLSSKKIVSVADPTTAQDAATKNYVDTRTPRITVSTTAPGSPATGDIWVDTN